MEVPWEGLAVSRIKDRQVKAGARDRSQAKGIERDTGIILCTKTPKTDNMSYVYNLVMSESLSWIETQQLRLRLALYTCLHHTTKT